LIVLVLKKSRTGTIPLNKRQNTVVISIGVVQIVFVIMFFTDTLATIKVPDYVLWTLWFFSATAGIVLAGFLIYKKNLNPYVFIILILGLVMLALGGLTMFIYAM
jgi:multidrug transporter EmrE-like cation transporter